MAETENEKRRVAAKVEQAKRRLVEAGAVAAAARKEYAAAVAESSAHPKPSPGWREAQARAAAAAVTLGEADGALAVAKRDAAGVEREEYAAGGGKLLVALVRVPARAADALRHGPGWLPAWIAEAIALQYRSDFDPDAGEPGNPWAVEVAALFGASADDGDAFEGVAAAAFDAGGEEARALAAIVEGRAECFPAADKGKGGGMA